MISKVPFKILSFGDLLYGSLEHISSKDHGIIGGSGAGGGGICIEMGHWTEVKSLDLMFDRHELKSRLYTSLSFLITEDHALSRVTLPHLPQMRMLEPEAGRSTWRVLKEPKIARTRFVIKGMEGKGQNWNWEIWSLRIDKNRHEG